MLSAAPSALQGLNNRERERGWLIVSSRYLPATRVVYDRVWKRKNYFEIPAFLQIE